MPTPCCGCLQNLRWRPAFWLRRRFGFSSGRFLAFGLAIALAACASPPAVPLATDEQAFPRVVDEKGPLDPHRAAAAVRRLESQGESDVLARHLAYVEHVVQAPLALGNEAHLLVDGPQTHAAMLKAIAAARRHIDLETYILESDGVGSRLADLLKAKRSEGVEIRVLYDSVGSIGTAPEYFRELKEAGIAVCEFNPINPLKAGRDGSWQVNNRDHRKILIVDGQTAFTGGINISAVYRSSSFKARRPPTPKEGWRDTHVQVRGPVVAEFQQLFLTAWEGQKCVPRAEAGYFPSQARRGDKPMRLVAADPETGRSEFYVVLLSAIEHSAQRVWLTYGYFVPDERMLQYLLTAARRGVDVRLVLPGFSDFWAPFHAGRSRYAVLLAAGVRIFERRDALLHAKTAVIDGVWSSIGSTNLDWRSFVHNYEADLLVLDAGFAREMEDLFQADEAACHEVTSEEWRRRSLVLHLKEWAARWWEYLL